MAVESVSHPRPPLWAVILAFAVLYTTWGTTYLAIKIGVETLPPAIFGGARLGLAGFLVLCYLRLRGHVLALPRRNDWLWLIVPAILFFVGGNGLLTVGEKYVASGVASVLGATTPLLMALMERFWPGGERLNGRGWLGVLLGLCGVLVLLAPQLGDPASFAQDLGPLLILASSISWSLGSVIARYRKVHAGHLVITGYQMLVGGGSLFVVGVLLGELGQLTPESLSPKAVGAFFYLLVMGSILGFTAFNWLLRNVSVTLAGTYAYVNPVVAIIVGWLLNDEPITAAIVGGIGIILAGVALVRHGNVATSARANPKLSGPRLPVRERAEPASCCSD
jgi:drug/metabolite transporter (DMT)-like permease